jgi:hypothetical protein
VSQDINGQAPRALSAVNTGAKTQPATTPAADARIAQNQLSKALSAHDTDFDDIIGVEVLGQAAINLSAK